MKGPPLLVCNVSRFQLKPCKSKGFHSTPSPRDISLEAFLTDPNNPKADPVVHVTPPKEHLLSEVHFPGGLSEFYIWEERSDVDEGALSLTLLTQLPFLLGNSISFLFSGRINFVFKGRASKKDLKIFLRDFSCPLSNSLENMSSESFFSVISQKELSKKLAHFSGKFALHIVNKEPVNMTKYF